MLVKKGNSIYLYQSFREEGVVRTKYCGHLSPKQIQEHQHSQEEQALRKQSYQQIISLLDDLDIFRAVNELLMRAGLLVNVNYYLRRSEIRRLKHES